MSIAIATACWGIYWERFGVRFANSIAKLNRKPDETIVVGEVEVAPIWIDTPRPVSPVCQWDWFNEAVQHSTSEWVLCLGIDDEILPAGLDDLPLTGDVVSITGLENGEPWRADRDGWRNLLSITENPMRGGTIFRRDVFLRYPWRRMRLCDWAQWIEFKHAQLEVRFDETPRFIHHRHVHANSMRVIVESEREISHFKKRLRCGSVSHYNACNPRS